MAVSMIAFAAPAGAVVGARRMAALPAARRARRSALAVTVPLRRPAVAAWYVPKATSSGLPPAAAGRPADELSAAAAAAAVPPAVAVAASVAAGTARPFWSVPAARARASVLSVARRALRAAVTAASTVRRVRVRHGAALRLARMAPTVALAVVGMFASRSFGPLAVGKLASVAVPAVPVVGSATAAAGGGGLAKAFAEAFGVVFLSEFGDKSMFATALMAMKHSPSMVFTGALLALTAMTLIACCLGQVMHFLPPIVTHYFSVALFVVFGAQMIIQSRSLSSTPGGDPPASGLPAVATAGSTAAGVAPAAPVAGGERAGAEELVASLNVQGEAESKVSVLLKIVSLIFVAEWCDRSMLATMALAASGNAVAVIGGATAANVLCTGMAVVAAVAVSSKISERMVALVSGILFEVFAVFTLIEGPESLD